MGTRSCSPEVRHGRLAKAEGFLQAAEDVSTLDDSGELHDAVVTLYVHAGIAAADVICCARLGLHATGDNHAEAVALLTKAGAASHRYLATLLGLKTKLATATPRPSPPTSGRLHGQRSIPSRTPGRPAHPAAETLDCSQHARLRPGPAALRPDSAKSGACVLGR